MVPAASCYSPGLCPIHSEGLLPTRPS